ncbi:titin isoform X2 [Culicoides brevitarsis]|uniref:titin isoform X2 n=1 Tax=Culicoides brevitarsis TaxID=469753 RepID=UPI00307B999D
MESPGPQPQIESFSNLLVEDENRKQKIDLQKLFTPSTDFEEIKPGKNRKLYASSAFWAPGVHPTVEDQVELARRISHSLSDISNQRSKGQSMYINRKKRSVKWVHTDGNQNEETYSYTDTSNRVNDHEERSEQTEITSSGPKKVPLKLVMNPQGTPKDFSSLQKSETMPILSPEPIISALKTPKEKGAELFAKRRKKSDKWIIDDENPEKRTTTQSQNYINTSTSVQESYNESAKKIEEAIETISQSINDMTPISNNTPAPDQQRKLDTPASYVATSLVSQSPTIIPYPRYQGLAYKPSIPQGWNAPPIKLSIELEEPFEDETPIKLFRKSSVKAADDENKENEIPDDDTSLKEELLKDEQEILEIYEDLDRHLKLIDDDHRKSLCESVETSNSRRESVNFPDPPKPPEIPVFKPINVLKILNEPPPPLPELQFNLEVDDESGTKSTKEGTAEEEGDEEDPDYPKISVKELIHTFENVQHQQKVHVREIDRMIKEPSTETESSEVPKYLPLFTGQQQPTVPAVPEPPKMPEELPKSFAPIFAPVVPRLEKSKSVPDLLKAPPAMPIPEFTPVEQRPTHEIVTKAHESLDIVNKLIEKHENRIKESQCDVVPMPKNVFNVVTKNSFNNHVGERQGNGYPEPIPEPPKPVEPPKPYELTIPVKRDALSNISPLPFIQNPSPLPTGVTVKLPEPEPPKKPDFSYEAFLHNSPPEEYNIPEAPKPLDLSSLMSYNTAPRGWGAAKEYYRPVHLGQKYDNMVYSDF